MKGEEVDRIRKGLRVRITEAVYFSAGLEEKGHALRGSNEIYMRLTSVVELSPAINAHTLGMASFRDI